MERIVNKHLLEHLESKGLLTPHQYGFRTGRSCELALATVVHTLSNHLDNRVACELVQLDFRQAFDRVSHDILLHKLWSMGIRGQVLQFLSSFLHDRSQRVVFRGVVPTFSLGCPRAASWARPCSMSS